MTKRKLYWMLMPPFAIVTFISFYLLPSDKKNYSFFIIFVFWAVYYYTLGYIERKNAKDHSRK